MQYIYYSIATWLIFFLCGLPFIFLPMPTYLAKYRFFLAPTFGYSYVMFFSYYLYRFNLPGTDSYAFFIFAIPLLVCAGLVWRYAKQKSLVGFPFPENASDSLRCVGHALISFIVMSIPYYVIGKGGLLAVSMGNLDLANYAVGTRILQEFPRSFQAGIFGLTKDFLSINDDYWFGASAIVGNVCSLLSKKPHEMQSMVMAVAASQGAGMIHIYFVENLKFTKLRSHCITIICAISPLYLYAVWQGFGGQIVSMPLIIFLILIATTWPDDPASLPDYKQYVPTFVLVASGILATYHYSLLIITVLVLGAHIVQVIFYKTGALFKRSLCLYAVAMLLTLAINPLRSQSLVITLNYVKDVAAGWFIPWASPTFILGINGGKLLMGTPAVLSSTYVYAITTALIILSAYTLARHRKRHAIVFYFGIFLPLMAMTIFFALRDYHGGDFGGYRSFKISSLFIPFLIGGILLFNGYEILSKKYINRTFSLITFICVIYCSLLSLTTITRLMTTYAYRSHRHMTELQRVESYTSVKGLNIPEYDNDTLMWISYFTLKVPQIFKNFPYSCRVIAEHNPDYKFLIYDDRERPHERIGDIFHVEYSDKKNIIPVGGGFGLLDGTQSNATLKIGLGWYGFEGTHRWSGSDDKSASIIVTVIGGNTRARLGGKYNYLADGDSIAIYINNEAVAAHYADGHLDTEEFLLKKGENVITITNQVSPRSLNPADSRVFTIMWTDITLTLNSADQTNRR